MDLLLFRDTQLRSGDSDLCLFLVMKLTKKSEFSELAILCNLSAT